MNSEMVRYQRYRAKCANRTAKKDPEVSIIIIISSVSRSLKQSQHPPSRPSPLTRCCSPSPRCPSPAPWARSARTRPPALSRPPRRRTFRYEHSRELKKCYKYVTIPLFKVDHIWWNWCFRKWIWGTRFQHLNVLSVKYKPVYFKRLGAQTVTIMKIYHL